MNVGAPDLPGRELLQMFGPSIALFADSGQAVERNLRLSGMKTDVGIGLRFGLARFESALLRFDIAYALNDDPVEPSRTRVLDLDDAGVLIPPQNWKPRPVFTTNR